LERSVRDEVEVMEYDEGMFMDDEDENGDEMELGSDDEMVVGSDGDMEYDSDSDGDMEYDSDSDGDMEDDSDIDDVGVDSGGGSSDRARKRVCV
jgi:hypothetical protein